MKVRIRQYLFLSPTLFPWLMALLVIATLYYLGIGLVGVFENSEAMMAFLIVIYAVPAIIFLGVLDHLLRRVFTGKLLPVWLIEISLTAAFGLWYYFHNFYVTEFVTEKNTPVFVMVLEPEKGMEVKRGGLFQFRTNYHIPGDNIIPVKEFMKENEWVRLKAQTVSGIRYKQVYPMYFMEKDTMRCENSIYKIQFFMLESDSTPRFIFSDKQFDSMRTAVCTKMSGQY